MFWLKSCPRCHGDLHDINDVGDRYISCLQCGRILTVAQEKALPQATIRALPSRARLTVIRGAA